MPSEGKGICRTLLASGQWSCLTVRREQESGGSQEADPVTVLGKASLDKPLKRRIREVAMLARLQESGAEAFAPVSIRMDPLPAEGERGWELALVIADRIARGLIRFDRTLLAMGWANYWETGQLEPLPEAEQKKIADLLRQPPEKKTVVIANLPESNGEFDQSFELQQISHLSGLFGHPGPSSEFRRARAWFPLIAGERSANNQLCWVEVGVSTHDGQKEKNLQFAGISDPALKAQVQEVLSLSRTMDGGNADGCKTVVRMEKAAFTDGSYQLALVLADRIARGLEVPAPGRVLATGCSGRWEDGVVEPVGYLPQKLELLLNHGREGDRVLIPEGGQEKLNLAEWKKRFANRGMSLLALERIE